MEYARYLIKSFVIGCQVEEILNSLYHFNIGLILMLPYHRDISVHSSASACSSLVNSFNICNRKCLNRPHMEFSRQLNLFSNIKINVFLYHAVSVDY